MNKKAAITLSVLILLLLCIIAAGVYELYRGIALPDFAAGKAQTEFPKSDNPPTVAAEDSLKAQTQLK